MDSTEAQEAKRAARKQALAARDAIPFIERLDRSAAICEQIGEYLRSRLPDVLTDAALSEPVAIPTPELPYKHPANPAGSAHVATGATDAARAAESAEDAPLACGAGQEWMFEPQSTRPLEERPVLALYSSMKSEVDLSELAHGAFAHQWRVCFPAMIKGNEAAAGGSKAADAGSAPANANEAPHMEFFEVSWAQLKSLLPSFLSKQLRSYTVAELANEGFPLVQPSAITAMVVPLVAFDENNNRLGYGGGNYDRYLPRLNSSAVVVGAAFNEQQLESIPTDSFDLPLPHIVHA